MHIIMPEQKWQLSYNVGEVWVSIGKAHYNGTGNDHIIIYCALEAPSKQGGTLSHNLLHYAGHITKALHPLLNNPLPLDDIINAGH